MLARSFRVALVPAALFAALVVGCSSGEEPVVDAPPETTPVVGATEAPADPSSTPIPTPPRTPTPGATQTPPPGVALPPVVATVVGGLPSPPVASASAGGSNVALGLGSYCWTPPGGPGLCADAVGIITGTSSLTVAPGGSLALGGPLLGAAVETSSATAWPRPAAPVATGDDWAAWSPRSGSASPGNQTLALDLDAGALAAPVLPGSYVVLVAVSFPQGDASYGLLVDVTAPTGGDTGARAPVFVASTQLLVLESFPIQLRLEVRGQLPTPCNEPRWSVQDDGTTIAVTLWSVSDPATSCIQVLEPFDLSIRLGELATGSRAVTLNGEAVGTASAGG
jgi:hypothetical protein